jgi:hypothetical protein
MILKPLPIADYNALEPFFANQWYTHCEYSLSSLLAWTNDLHKPAGTVDGDTLILGYEFSRDDDTPFLILPVSPDKSHSPEDLHAIAQKTGYSSYRYVSENYFDRFPKETVTPYFDIEEEPEYTDYVYLKDDLASLGGNRYSKKRNLVNQFTRTHIDKERVLMKPITPAMGPACIDFLEEWCLERECGSDPAEDLACEKIALINALTHYETLKLSGLAVYVDDRICAFGIASHLTRDMGVLHFEKAFPTLRACINSLTRNAPANCFLDICISTKKATWGYRDWPRQNNPICRPVW